MYELFKINVEKVDKMNIKGKFGSTFFKGGKIEMVFMILYKL
jgi:hypothetical protein